MRLGIATAGALILFLLCCAPSALAQTPTITNVTNAAIPAIDYPPVAVQLAPRSIATIFGTNLADAVVTSVPPWKTVLGGTEVHFVVDTVILNNIRIACQWQTDPGCELTMNLVYASPTQINFVTPDSHITASNGSAVPVLATGRIILIRDGVRFDARYDISGGAGYMTLDPFGYTRNPVVFGVGYECLFSFSLTDPSACGLSWSQGQHRALLGAVTDISGNLITSQNPVHQGELIILWMTGLTGLNVDPKTGLLQQTNPGPVGFGVAQNGNDIPATGSYNSFDASFTGLFNTPAALFAGESPQFVGLDQVDVYFPVCGAQKKATAEKRYDAFLFFQSSVNNARIYLPFVVSPGDPDCQWVVTLASGKNPSLFGQPVTFTVTVTPSTATGTVTLFDGTTALSMMPLNGAAATFVASSLSQGTHQMSATYSGDSKNGGGTSDVLNQVVNAVAKTNTTTTLVSNLNPSNSGQMVTFVANVTGAAGGETVTFWDGANQIGSGSTLRLGNGGQATFSTSTLSTGTHLITAKYGGDTFFNASTSAVLMQIVK